MTLPNKITLARILCLPGVVTLLYSSHFKLFVAGFFLAWIFGFSDFLDGYLARRLGQVSILGKIIDPIADKLFVLLICLYFVHLRVLPAWVLILLVSRELIISDFRIWARKMGKEVAVSNVGKWKAAFQFFLLGYLGWVRFFMFRHPDRENVGGWPIYFQVGYYFFLIVALLLTLVSLVEYFWSNRNLLRAEAPLRRR